jgi:hypothetical protein
VPGAGHGCVSVWKLTSERHRIDGVEPHATEQATFDSHAGAYLGVAQGASSDNEAQFIHLTYKRGVPKTKLAIVGKGLTYDSGGYNLKPSAGGMIELMKFDMGGALAASYLAIDARRGSFSILRPFGPRRGPCGVSERRRRVDGADATQRQPYASRRRRGDAGMRLGRRFPGGAGLSRAAWKSIATPVIAFPRRRDPLHRRGLREHD